MRRLKLLWQLAGNIKRIKESPTGYVTIVFHENVELQVLDIFYGISNYK